MSDAIIHKELSTVQIDEELYQLPDPYDMSDQLFRWLGSIRARDYPKHKPREMFSNKVNKLTENLRYLKDDHLERVVSVLKTL
ncbi:MAG: hypothetical protein QXS05_05385, partial [Candidatus Bathyarchaeia archaeon]